MLHELEWSSNFSTFYVWSAGKSAEERTSEAPDDGRDDGRDWCRHRQDIHVTSQNKLEKIFNLKIFDAAVVLIGSHINQVWESIYMLWPPICSSQSKDNLTDRGYLRLYLQLRVFFLEFSRWNKLTQLTCASRKCFSFVPGTSLMWSRGWYMQNWQFLHSRIFVYYFQTMIYVLWYELNDVNPYSINLSIMDLRTPRCGQAPRGTRVWYSRVSDN